MDGKTVVGHRLVLLVVFQARHTLQEFFEVSPLGSFEGIGIDDRGIALHLHLLDGSGHHHLVEIERLEDGILLRGTTSPYRITRHSKTKIPFVMRKE